MTNNIHLPKTETVRKPYRKPRLESLGDLRSLTLGGSFGTGESGSTMRKVQVGLPEPIGVHRPDGTILLPDGSLLLPNGNIVPPGEVPGP
jgi:hypothetical protein